MTTYRRLRARRALNRAIRARDWLVVGLLSGGGVRL